MLRRLRWGISLIFLLSVGIAVQAQESYLDEYVAHVKPGQRAAFDAAVKKMVAANRGDQGDKWVTLENVYGDANTIRFVSTRSSFADAEKGSATFDAAITKALGPQGAQKLGQDFDNTLNEGTGVLLRRRPDLSANMPSDPAAQAKIVGNTRWVRIVRIVVRIGMGPRFEELAKQVKTAEEKAGPNIHSWISQSVAGDRATVYYVAELQPSLAAFDGSPSLPQLMGNDTYQALLKSASEVIQTEDISIGRFVASLSNPPADTLNTAPDFWNPKPAAPKAAAAKPATKITPRSHEH